jgi:hypothetical protein
LKELGRKNLNWIVAQSSHMRQPRNVRVLTGSRAVLTSLCCLPWTLPWPPPRQFQNAVPELFTDLYVFGVLGGAPVHLKWRGDLSRLKKTCFGHIAQPGGASGGTVPLDALPSVKPEGRAVPEPGFQASSVV